MRATFSRRALIAGATVVLMSGMQASGQTDAVEPARPEAGTAAGHFGGGVGMTVVPARLFVGLSTTESDGFSYVTYSFPQVLSRGWAPLGLPNGAEITQICGVVYDGSWCASAALRLLGWEYPNVAGGATTPVQTLALAATDWGPFPGYTVACVVPAAPIRVRSTGNLDGDGDSGFTGYALEAQIIAGPCGGAPPPLLPTLGDVGFGAAIVHWRRTVSPAPAAASFGDVPTTHPFFRFVEALVAAGVTGGCGGGNYCPDTPITRGQMAVFLANALGLHWPN